MHTHATLNYNSVYTFLRAGRLKQMSVRGKYGSTNRGKNIQFVRSPLLWFPLSLPVLTAWAGCISVFSSFAQGVTVAKSDSWAWGVTTLFLRRFPGFELLGFFL